LNLKNRVRLQSYIDRLVKKTYILSVQEGEMSSGIIIVVN